ncbi:MAG: hemerythrin family protein [Sulfuricella sp.]|nr:hemerythrin family protein [Sulfuricella sp.]
MSFVDWSQAYTVNNPSLDEQHQKLFAIINKLHEAMFAKRGRESVGETIRELVEYTQKHFSEEERQMELHGYAGLAAHKKVHEELLKKVKEIEKHYQQSSESVAGEMIGFLVSDWLVKHILGMDKQYAPYLKGNRHQ